MEQRAREHMRKYPLFSACGLNCGLCPRYHTVGGSRCPGCGAEGFSQKHPACGVLSCCRRHEVEHCGLCGEYPCARYDGAAQYDSFITHQNQLKNFIKIKETGFEAYKAELERKIALLAELLENFDDGRKKSYFCLAIDLLELEDIESVTSRLAADGRAGSLKEKAAAAVGLFENAARKRGVTLKLRKLTAGVKTE